MNDNNIFTEYLNQILASLKTIDPKLVMIFGSFSKGIINENSDLDLLVVLNQTEIPKNYDEKLEMKLMIRKLIRDINKKIPIDLIVYTIPEYEAFRKGHSSFSKEVMKTGKIIYEKAS